LTGVIPSRREGEFRHPACILFPRNQHFSPAWRFDLRGTFVPKLDYFRSRCAMLIVALIVETEGGKQRF
jgi:hypothetical protein